MAKKRKRKGRKAVRKSTNKTSSNKSINKLNNTQNKSNGTKPKIAPKQQNKVITTPAQVHKSTATQNKLKRQSVPRKRTISKKNSNLKPAKENNFFRTLFNIISGKSVRKKIDLTKEHPRFPFWARLRMEKWRTTLVIDEEKSLNNKTNKVEDQFVHREATSPKEDEKRNKKFERISPNPDKDKATKGIDMLLKSPNKHPKYKFEPHNKDLDMPQHLKDKYDKNNFKDKKT